MAYFYLPWRVKFVGVKPPKLGLFLKKIWLILADFSNTGWCGLQMNIVHILRSNISRFFVVLPPSEKRSINRLSSSRTLLRNNLVGIGLHVLVALEVSDLFGI